MDLDHAKRNIAAARASRGVALDVLAELLDLVVALDDQLTKTRQRVKVLDDQVRTLQQRVDQPDWREHR